MKTLKKLWRMLARSKTNLYAAAIAGLSTLQLAMPSFANSMTPELVTAIGVGIAMGIAYFRTLTTGPLKDKVER
jgi:hypothetical protein